MTERTAWQCSLAGWLLFTLSALFFIWAALVAGDRVSLVASVLFLVACLIFLVPVWCRRPRAKGNAE